MLNTLMILTFVSAQQAAPTGKPDEPKIRYDISPLVKLYQQSTPKLALESTVKAMEKARYDYVAAHLLDPAYVDTASIERGKAFTNDVSDEFNRQRLQEKKNPPSLTRVALPDDPEKLKVLIDAECQSRGFRKLLDDLKQLATDDPSQIRELRRFLRDGVITETGETAKITLADTKDKAVFLVKKENRWYVENRQLETKAAEPAKEPMNP